jgi:tRNA threonylcarbamoyladenosine modification (KEOPS) complex  Pcc1 subunit
MKHELNLSVEFCDKKMLESAYQTLKNEKNLGRAECTVSKNENSIIIKITSEDATSLRASVNSYLRNIQVIENLRCIDGRQDE